MTKAERVKAKIRKKFGTVSEFCRVAGYDQYDAQKAFMPFYARDSEFVKFLEEMSLKCEQIKYSPADKALPKKKRELLREAIMQSGGVSEFCAKEGYKEVTVHQVLQGTRKTMSRTVKKLLLHFKIE